MIEPSLGSKISLIDLALDSVGKLVGRKFPLGDHPSIQIEEDVPREIWESEAAAIEPHANIQLRV